MLAKRLKTLLRAAGPEWAYAIYRRLRVRREIASYGARTAQHTYGRQQFYVSLEDPLAAGWYDHDWPVPKELAVLERFGLGEGAVIFDLGAHQAVVAMIASQLVGSSGRVIAVEAQPHNVRVARRNIALNALSNVDVVWGAVADETGEALFTFELNGRAMPGRRAGKLRVPATTIDELARRFAPPDAVLLDIEGGELIALAGATNTLRGEAMFVVEAHIGCGLEQLGGSATELLSVLFEQRKVVLVSSADGDDGWRPPTEPPTSRVFIFANGG